MSQSQDEARAARIQKYKEERRKQLTARTATLFSANVTERRPRKAADRCQSDDTADHLKSSSELNLNTASASVPIRTTRTSRLRAAASAHSDSSPSSRKSNRSASVQSLSEEGKNKLTKISKIVDRDKRSSINKRQSNEKENLKSTLPAGYSDKDIGAIKTKSKHSTNKTILEKDKRNYLVSSPKGKNVGDKISSSSKLEERNNSNSLVEKKKLDSLKNGEKNEAPLKVNEEQIFNDLLGYPSVSENLEKDNIDDLFNDLVEVTSQKKVNDDKLVLNYSHKDSNIPVLQEAASLNKVVNVVNVEDSGEVVPKLVKSQEVGGLLGAVCVRKVERFSELLSNLCSPCEADVLFEDILVENGINGNLRDPECTPPCRRAQPTRTTSTPKRGQAQTTAVNNEATGNTARTKNRRSLESHTSLPKTENSLPSSRVSPKNTFNLPFGIKSPLLKSSTTNTVISKTNERRRSSENAAKPSCIPLSKKTIEKSIRTSVSPNKQDTVTTQKPDSKLKTEYNRGKSIRRSPEKAKSDTENTSNDRRHRAQKDSESLSEKYHYSKKRLTSLENNSPRDKNDTRNSPSKNVLKQNSHVNLKTDASAKLEETKDAGKMSTLHETLRPHTSNSRLSQEMDSLAALTKQTLDRVNKLSNNLNSNKLNLDASEPSFDSLFAPNSDQKNNHNINYGLNNERPIQNRGVSERLQDIDRAAQRLIDFEKQSAMFSDLSDDTSSQNRRLDNSLTSCSHTPVSILKRKSINEENAISTANQAIASPPVTFSPSVIEPRSCRFENRQRQGILKKRRSLDESQVARRRSCSPEVSFADDGSLDTNKPILKNRRSSLEDVVRNRSPDGHIQGILKRKMSREEDHTIEDISHGSPEPHGILKRKSNSSSSSSTTSSHVSIAQAVLLAAAGGAEIVDDDKEIVRPILKKKSFSEERPSLDVLPSDTPKPILKKKSTEHDDHEFDLPKKPILKSSKKLSGDEGHASSFDLSEDDRSSRRPSLLRSRTSDQSGSECEATVKPILKQRGSSLTRERSQSPRPRLSFCADNDTNISVTNFSCDANDLLAAGPRRVLNIAHEPEESYPSAVLRRRNLRPKSNPRSKSLACDVNDELLSILNNRRIKVDENCENGYCETWELKNSVDTEDNNTVKTFPSIAARIKSMEQALTDVKGRDMPSTSKSKIRDKERFKTQPITIEEMRSVTSSLEPGQVSFQAFGPAGCSFPSRPVESSVAPSDRGPFSGKPERDPFADFAKTLDSPPFGANSFTIKTPIVNGIQNGPHVKDDSFGEATFLDFEKDKNQATLDEIEQEVNKVRVALDEDCRALDEDERQQAEADNWSLNVSCDSGVYNRASSRDSGPHSGEELGLIESQEIRDNQATNSSSNEWSSSSIERGLLKMNRVRKPSETEVVRSPEDLGSDDDGNTENSGFALGLVKSNSVVARASMWQQLQQQAKGTPKPLIRHSRSKNKDAPSVADRFKTQPISFSSSDPTEPSKEGFSLAQSKSTANVLDRDEDDLDDDSPSERAQRMITPEVRGILKSGTTVVPTKPKTLAKGESSEGLKDEGIDSSSDDESASASSVSSSEKSCSSSDSSDEIPGPKPRRFQRKSNKLKSSRTDSDLTRLQDRYPGKIQLPGANELKERLNQVKNPEMKPLLAKLGRKPSEEAKKEDDSTRYRRFVKKLDEPIQLGKLRRPADKTPPPPPQIEEKPPQVLKISAINQAAKNKFFGIETPPKKERDIDELTAAVRKYIPPVSKSISTHMLGMVAGPGIVGGAAGSGSDGESSGGREVRHITSHARPRHRLVCIRPN
ncbi:uncharacterized protein LOC113521302 isoform X2 [Galleria mellonella]|uniref:Uncharacterized protein LOC113521302 isoform X2 n=1 Tax=Galleria mellonella TaxID=7137 RepID=A0ABM3N5P9_GALME|nr:uncharacterized protein LOC113521302 isoform X2 [Galleria mellonella]